MDSALDIVLVEQEHGRAVLSAPPSASFANADGGLHGGWVATLLDAAAGAAVQSTLSPGERYATVALSISYLRGISPDRARIRATGRVLRRGSRVITSEAQIVDGDSKVCAVGTASCLVVSSKDEPARRDADQPR